MYMARKKFILLKQASIIFQAYYKGRLARKRYVILLREEEERRKREEELLRKKREREKHEAQRKESEFIVMIIQVSWRDVCLSCL